MCKNVNAQSTDHEQMENSTMVISMPYYACNPSNISCHFCKQTKGRQYLGVLSNRKSHVVLDPFPIHSLWWLSLSTLSIFFDQTSFGNTSSLTLFRNPPSPFSCASFPNLSLRNTLFVSLVDSSISSYLLRQDTAKRDHGLRRRLWWWSRRRILQRVR